MDDWQHTQEKISDEEWWESSNHDHFINYYSLSENNGIRNSLIGFYFAFTTLSTVGFGDFTPRSDVER